MAKTWYIQHRSQGRILKTYGRLNHIHTLPERLKEAERLISILIEPSTILIRQRTDLISNLSAVLEYKRPEFARKTYQTYFSQFKYFSAWYRVEAMTRKDVSPGEYIRHMHEAGYHNNYKIKAKIFLGSLFKQLVKDGKYPSNPFADIKIKKVKGQSLLAFHPDQVAAIKKRVLQLDPQLWDAILFQYYLFFRPAEIRQLKIENILFEEMKIVVGVSITKDDDVLRKAIPKPMQTLIRKYGQCPPGWYIFSRNGQPGPGMLSINNLNKRHRVILDLLGISHQYAFYSWVHTGIRQSAMSGIPHKQLQLQKGHSDLQVFDEYLKNIGVDDCVQLINNFPAI